MTRAETNRLSGPLAERPAAAPAAALATYTSDPESTEYTEATVANLNALRVAYENLRASHEDLRAKLIAAGVVS